MSQSFAFLVTPESHYEAFRVVIRRTVGRKLFHGIVFLPLFVIVASAVLSQRPIIDALWVVPWIWMPPPILVFLVVPWLERRQITSAHRSTPSLGGEQRYTFDDSGVRMSGPMSNVDLQWSAITQVVETADFFLFYFSKNCAYFLPQDAIGSEGEREQLRVLLDAQVPGRFKSHRKAA